MSREVRKVSRHWVHLKRSNGGYKPLIDSDYEKDCKEWDFEEKQWKKGFIKNWLHDNWEPKTEEHTDMSFDEWKGCSRPCLYAYMPQWRESEKTHYMMYETTSEGTPISPAFSTPEKLARWLADTGASSFADMTENYDTWFKMIELGSRTVSMVMENGETKSGVKAASDSARLEIIDKEIL